MKSYEIKKLLEEHEDLNVLSDCIQESDELVDVRDILLDGVLEQEIIYYKNAIDYLSEYDSSFMQSLEIADEFGYTVKQLNSELLATLLYQHNLQEALNQFFIDNEIA